jgi:hypothetical protein
MLGAAAVAAAPNPAAEPWGDDRAPESAADLASRDRGAERADGVAAQEGGAVGAATLGATAGAAAPDPAAEPRGDDHARRGAEGRAGGAGRVQGVAAQVNERVDGVAAQEGGAAWQQGVQTEVRGLLPSFLAYEGSKTGESMPKFGDVSGGTSVAAQVDGRADGVAAQGSVVTTLRLLFPLLLPFLLLLLAGNASKGGSDLALPEFYSGSSVPDLGHTSGGTSFARAGGVTGTGPVALGVPGTDLVGGSERVVGVDASEGSVLGVHFPRTDARGRCVEGAARWAWGGAWRTRRGGRDRRGRGGGAALAHHA